MLFNQIHGAVRRLAGHLNHIGQTVRSVAHLRQDFFLLGITRVYLEVRIASWRLRVSRPTSRYRL